MRYLLCLLLTGCAATYAPTGPSAINFDSALLDCETRFAAIQDGWARQGYVHRCMAMRGWTRESGW